MDQRGLKALLPVHVRARGQVPGLHPATPRRIAELD
jgi:hypothetical protein